MKSKLAKEVLFSTQLQRDKFLRKLKLRRIKKLFAIVTSAYLLVAAAWAQQPAFLTNSVAWDASPSPNIAAYVVTLTTNRVAMTTNGYVPPASAIISVDTTTSTQIAITNVWPGITNGIYSIFVQARSTSGLDSITSSNLVFTMNIPPLPVRNLRLQ